MINWSKYDPELSKPLTLGEWIGVSFFMAVFIIAILKFFGH